jgi:hypothetical protein
MAGLNQRQWLNIIIFVISVLFILSLLLNKKMQSSMVHTETQSTHSESNYSLSQDLVMIEFAQTKLIKTNNQWLAVGHPIEQSKINRLADLWIEVLQQQMPSQKTVKSEFSVAPSRAESQVKNRVKLYLQQRQQPIDILLIQQDQQHYLYFKTINIEIQLSADLVGTYFP